MTQVQQRRIDGAVGVPDSEIPRSPARVRGTWSVPSGTWRGRLSYIAAHPRRSARGRRLARPRRQPRDHVFKRLDTQAVAINPAAVRWDWGTASTGLLPLKNATSCAIFLYVFGNYVLATGCLLRR
jgi:hypothetical protein